MTAPWRPLPASLAPEVAYLVGQLRELKDRSGLSLAKLAAKTPYSKSSWERYLNGSALPPRPAVKDLAQLTGEPVERLLALWERAEARWSGRAAVPLPTTAEPEPRSTPADPKRDSLSRPRRHNLVLTIAVTGAVIAVIVALAFPRVLPGVAPSGRTAPTYTVGCRGTQCTAGDAQGMACGLDAASFADLQVDGTYLELRISDQCQAAWARVSHTAIGDRVSVVDERGQAETISVSDPTVPDTYLPTRMIAADQHSHVRACLERTEERHCTPWGSGHPVHVPPTTTHRG
ncbi:helix-turn-helix domain-containing protein [Amycolatopsis pithecellobii]|uniref:DUF2690 domain-containing protein n=1 Tax=Amycolatopsis pithecellobii TaxID=664692 RepID=A0A6N7Z5Y2_9PSEU|nr:XRE family transcriptional regulator [Amycolatopsis pithecellobii]MTD57179.1 DUF2690 domain-containing protein [Amycolatopsis pithecellobii]